MASGNFVLDKGFDAAGAVRKFRAVVLTGNVQEVAEATNAGGYVLGISQYGVTSAEITKGKGVSARLMGNSEWEASEAINIGDELKVTNDGRCAKATAGSRVVGLCIGDAAGTAGDRITAQLYTGGGFVS